jgi:hypothetical protein
MNRNDRVEARPSSSPDEQLFVVELLEIAVDGAG